MRRAAPDPGRRPRRLLSAAVCALGLASGAAFAAPADIVGTKHNLSATGTGTVRALTETRICVFCHTPHNATPLSPLWNKELEPQIYSVYASPSLRAGPLPQPTGTTKLCLSCHDGTIAMGAVVNPAGGIAMAGTDRLPTGSLSNFGLDLSGHHPVSFPYHAALPNPQLSPTPPPDLVFGGTDEVHCITCHDPHDDSNGRFLVRDNRNSALCVTCHDIRGWANSAHATSTAPVAGILPRPPKTWPNYAELGEWGCEACHAPHFAPTAEYLLNFTTAPPNPFSCTSAGCHSSSPVPPNASRQATLVAAHSGQEVRGGGHRADIAQQVRQVSAHRLPEMVPVPTTSARGGAARSGIRYVVCADCHNPHLLNDTPNEPPYVSGMLTGVSGVDRNGIEVGRVNYEYEVCFKCHADNTPDLDYVPRVVAQTNKRLAFDPGNPSYHPVVEVGRNLDVPSIPSPLSPALSVGQLIYCTACHADDRGGSRGPHGSAFAPILRERYETADYTPESFENYALCYRCHNRSSIVSDVSFRKKAFRSTPSGGGHSGHLVAGAPCSACHDPHGVYAGGSTATGSHTHLVNFDTRIVLPRPGNSYPVFNDLGTYSGSCDLVCHGVVHQGTSYP